MGRRGAAGARLRGARRRRTYPEWWTPIYKEVESDGPPEVGRVSRQRFSAKLPYTLSTTSKIVSMDSPRSFEVDVDGDLRDTASGP